MVKQILMHEVVVALIIVSCQTLVLVQICCLYLGKVQVPVFIFCNQVFVSSDR